ncbi:MAG TPA: RcnB family protein [Ramlibacter sp.]|nr:RcnB family protein [Ramlibacter sp.]
MNTKTILCSIAIASLGFSSVSIAQPSRQDARQDAREARQDIREAQRDMRRADDPREARDARQDLREGRRDLREAREDRREARRFHNARSAEFRRGGRLPPELRDRHYVVNDWRGHRLSAPPRGYHWVQVGPDYVLAAVATGIIANLILNQ